MATQRMTAATFVGATADVVAELFAGWRVKADQTALDRFCASLRDHSLSLSVVYFCEWVDRWSMGDSLPGNVVEGQRFQAVCLSPEQAVEHATQCGSQFFEERWLATRLEEASFDCAGVAGQAVVVLIREVVGPTTIDEEVRQSRSVIPAWLASVKRHTEAAAADRPIPPS